MAITDTRPQSDPAVASPAAPEAQVRVVVLGSGDHKTIGRLYIVVALLFGIAGWVATALAGAHSISDGDFLSDSAAFTLFTAGRLGLVLLVIVPLLLGLATYVVPLQVGANTVAFPRMAAGAFWLWLLGGGVLIVANAIDGGIGGGRSEAVDMGLLAIVTVVVALLLGTVSVLTTAIALRAPGLPLDRVPAFTWATLVGGAMWIFTLPALVANVAIIYIDHHYGRPADFGVEANMWAQLSWVVHQPQIYAFAIPALGILLDVVATLGGVRLKHRGVMYGLIAAFGALSFGAFAQPYFYPQVTEELTWAAVSIAIALPTLALIGGLAATLKGGRPSAKSPLALALVSALLLLGGVVAGVLAVITPLELRETSAFADGQFALVMAAGLTGALAGVMYWAPKITGRFANEGAGKLVVLLTLVGGALAGLPLCVLGFATKFDGLADAADALNGLAVAGDAVLALALLVAALALFSGLRGATAAPDAWGTGQSLEWLADSPPATGNFGELPQIHSPEPLLDAAEPSQEA